jgi:osmotically-inducible protein OsmY
MTILRTALLASSLSLLLSACGSFLATMEADTIEDDPGERTMGQLIEDDNIETKAIVNIAGQVSSEQLKATATDVVRKIHGVRRIYNELEIASPSSGMTRTSDTWITTKVKSWLLGSTNIQGTRVKVVTENGVVYLMGLATREEAQRITDKAAGIGGVQRVVRLFEIID